MGISSKTLLQTWLFFKYLVICAAFVFVKPTYSLTVNFLSEPTIVINSSDTHVFQPLTIERESSFNVFTQQTLEPFWQQQARTGTFVNQQGLTLHYAYVVPKQVKASILLLSGRSESYLKYKEVIYDLFQQGYAVFSVDHQGQGLSNRLLNNKHKGYIRDYNDYVQDVEQFVQQIVTPKQQGELLLLTHSMGGTIGLRYIQQYPNRIAKAAFVAPMWGLPYGSAPKWLAKAAVSIGAKLSGLFSNDAWYFVGNGDYEVGVFEGNGLSSSAARFNYANDLEKNTPAIQLGGVTFTWIDASIAALDQAYEALDKVSIPVLVLQAGSDTVIDNREQNRFCERLVQLNHACESGAPIRLGGAQHELLMENDTIRSQTLNEILSFFRPQFQAIS